MPQVILYRAWGGLCVMQPTGLLPVAETARKDVPKGVPYLVRDTAELPANWFELDDWPCDFSQPDGHGIGQLAWRIGDLEKKLAAVLDQAPSIPDAEPLVVACSSAFRVLRRETAAAEDAGAQSPLLAAADQAVVIAIDRIRVAIEAAKAGAQSAGGAA